VRESGESGGWRISLYVWVLKIHQDEAEGSMSDEWTAITLIGTVEKVIPAIEDYRAETAQITVAGAEELYREIRVENAFRNAAGSPVRLRQGAELEITIATRCS
jgi:hypothetical protein